MNLNRSSRWRYASARGVLGAETKLALAIGLLHLVRIGIGVGDLGVLGQASHVRGLVHEVLETQAAIARGLEDTADLECPRDLCSSREEPEHLHGITNEPAGQDGESETLARLGLHVGQHLRQRQCSFDR